MSRTHESCPGIATSRRCPEPRRLISGSKNEKDLPIMVRHDPREQTLTVPRHTDLQQWLAY